MMPPLIIPLALFTWVARIRMSKTFWPAHSHSPQKPWRWWGSCHWWWGSLLGQRQTTKTNQIWDLFKNHSLHINCKPGEWRPLCPLWWQPPFGVINIAQCVHWTIFSPRPSAVGHIVQPRNCPIIELMFEDLFERTVGTCSKCSSNLLSLQF